MKDDATFGELIDLCNKVGWDKTLKNLAKIVSQNDNVQAYLFSGDYNQQQRAQNLSRTIVRKNFTIAKLKKYREENHL